VSLDQSNVVDAIGIDDSSGRVILVIRHDAPWDGAAPQLYLLQEKLNAYLSFALDGEMLEAYPHFANRPIGIRIDTTSNPDPRTLHLLAHVRRQIQFQDITLEIRVPQCSPGCDCH